MVELQRASVSGRLPCQSTINMDGTLYGENVPKSRVGKPFLIMNAETSDDSTKDF